MNLKRNTETNNFGRKMRKTPSCIEIRAKVWQCSLPQNQFVAFIFVRPLLSGTP